MTITERTAVLRIIAAQVDAYTAAEREAWSEYMKANRPDADFVAARDNWLKANTALDTARDMYLWTASAMSREQQ